MGRAFPTRMMHLVMILLSLLVDEQAARETRLAEWQGGDYAAWVDLYARNLIDEVEEPLDELGLRFFARLEQQRPRALGERDSEAWVSRYMALLQRVDFDEPDTIRRLNLLEAVRPAELVGLEAYRVWLAGVAELTGHPGDRYRSVRAFLYQPCARDATELHAFGWAYAARTRQVPAKPARCPITPGA